MLYLLVIPAVLLLVILLVYLVKKHDDRKTEEDVLQFMIQHPNSTSLYIVENDDVVVNYQSDQAMPLASVHKLIVAIEFSVQAANRQINKEELVPLSEVEKYYIPGTDGKAHAHWLAHLRQLGHVAEHRVSLFQIAKGMMQFSSNANTEYLLARPGIESVNERLIQLGMIRHDQIYPVSSAMLLLQDVIETEKVSASHALQFIEHLHYEQYAERALNLFYNVNKNKDYIDQLKKGSKTIKFQQIWSSKQPFSTTKEYANLLGRIQKGTLFPEDVNHMIKDLIDVSPNKQSKFIRIGRKGGSTLTICNQVSYCEDKAGNQFQIAIFVHHPKQYELLWLEKKQNLFIYKFLYDQKFKERVQNKLNQANKANSPNAYN